MWFQLAGKCGGGGEHRWCREHPTVTHPTASACLLVQTGLDMNRLPMRTSINDNTKLSVNGHQWKGQEENTNTSQSKSLSKSLKQHAFTQRIKVLFLNWKQDKFKHLCWYYSIGSRWVVRWLPEHGTSPVKFSCGIYLTMRCSMINKTQRQILWKT